MRSIRVLVIDDSVVVRRMLTEILSSDPRIDAVETASNAAVALSKIVQWEPDVVTLDVEMPDMSGIELLSRIRRTDPRLPVVMFSALTQRAAAATIEALALGATDYVAKPEGTGSREISIAHIRTELLPKITALGHRGRASAGPGRGQAPPKALASAGPRASAKPPQVVAIGSSTGGPNALASLFRKFPASFPVPILIVQHMPPVFTKLLAERLSATCPLAFHEAQEGDVIAPGGAWIAPGDHHMRVVCDGLQVRLTLDRSPPENSCRPAVDVLLRSVAAVYQDRVLALILTGMGQDGLKGCQLLRSLGAQIVVQDESTSVVWGMPGFVAKAGIADGIVPLDDLPADIERRVAPHAQAFAAAEPCHAR